MCQDCRIILLFAFVDLHRNVEKAPPIFSSSYFSPRLGFGVHVIWIVEDGSGLSEVYVLVGVG